VERCPRCGRQAIGCHCVLEVNGIDPASLEREHPDVWEHGLADSMWAKFDAEWGARRQPWTGEWPGAAECREYGLWCRAVAGKGWVPCEAGDPGATEDLNRLASPDFRWDAERGRWVGR
jgi:hypothetical protein